MDDLLPRPFVRIKPRALGWALWFVAMIAIGVPVTFGVIILTAI
jgi:hypothetical protein